jgi:hypothetical protein
MNEKNQLEQKRAYAAVRVATATVGIGTCLAVLVADVYFTVLPLLPMVPQAFQWFAWVLSTITTPVEVFGVLYAGNKLGRGGMKSESSTEYYFIISTFIIVTIIDVVTNFAGMKQLIDQSGTQADSLAYIAMAGFSILMANIEILLTWFVSLFFVYKSEYSTIAAELAKKYPDEDVIAYQQEIGHSGKPGKRSGQGQLEGFDRQQ